MWASRRVAIRLTDSPSLPISVSATGSVEYAVRDAIEAVTKHDVIAFLTWAGSGSSLPMIGLLLLGACGSEPDPSVAPPPPPKPLQVNDDFESTLQDSHPKDAIVSGEERGACRQTARS